MLINTKDWWGSMLTLAYSSNHSFSLKVRCGGYLFGHATGNYHSNKWYVIKTGSEYVRMEHVGSGFLNFSVLKALIR